MKYETLHWCIFNILLRMFGCVALLFAFVAVLTAALQFAGASLATPGISPLGNFILAVSGLAIAVIVLKVRPYRPDLGKQDKQQLKLGWWTGTPK
jgi:hypothetical protein